MRKKDYTMIAKVLKDEYRASTVIHTDADGKLSDMGIGQTLALDFVQNGLVKAFEQNDPKFDAYKFKKACAIEARFQS